MKRIVIPHVELDLGDIKGISDAIGSLEKGLAIDTLPWPDFYGYRPDVRFMAFYTNDGIIVKYSVKELSIRALYGNDNEPVYEDSCVEFFFSPGSDENYFNFEFNCIGTLLAQYGESREKRREIDVSLLKDVKRYSTLGNNTFHEKTVGFTDNGFEWELTVGIPFSLIFSVSGFSGGIDELKRLGGRGNFYKCGDGLSKPHYVVWSRIDTPSPDFHRPEYFGSIIFA